MLCTTLHNTFSVTVQTISPYKMRSQTDINSKFHQVLSYNVQYLWLFMIWHSLVMTSWRWWLTQTLVEIFKLLPRSAGHLPISPRLGAPPCGIQGWTEEHCGNSTDFCPAWCWMSKPPQFPGKGKVPQAPQNSQIDKLDDAGCKETTKLLSKMCFGSLIVGW